MKTDFNNNNDELIIQLQKEIFELKQKITESKNVDITDSKLYKKRRIDILYLIKSGKQVKQSTREKYNIK